MGEEEIMRQEGGGEPVRLCDFCGQSRALLYCRADAAALCLACDRHVHLANSVSSKHPRSLLCDACSAAAASILCSSHAPSRVLCSNCDFDAHNNNNNNNNNNRAHERRPVETFSGCPTAAELVAVLGVGEGEEVLKNKDYDNGFDDFSDERSNSIWDYTPQVVRLDDLIVDSSDSSHGFQAMGVPPLPKNRNLACGKQREEILRQLPELIKSESQLSNDFEEKIDPISEFQPQLPRNNDQQGNLHPDFNQDATLTVTPSFEASELQWNNSDWHEATDPVIFPYDHQQAGKLSVMIPSFPDGLAGFHTSVCPAGGSDGDPSHHIVGESLSPLTPKHGLEFLCPDRDSVISRYKEKRKTRRYDKLIRYESRKARADSRVRIKGRFAKVNPVPKS